MVQPACSPAQMLMGEDEQQGKYGKCVLSTLRLNINKVYTSIALLSVWDVS